MGNGEPQLSCEAWVHAMKNLIHELEQATEGSRELDEKILASLGTHVRERRGNDLKAWWYPVNGPDHKRLSVGLRSWSGAIPDYTTSLDAALTLVPPEWRIRSLSENEGDKSEWGWGCQQIFCGDPDNPPKIYYTTSIAWTASLALCIAALGAREQVDD